MDITSSRGWRDGGGQGGYYIKGDGGGWVGEIGERRGGRGKGGGG